MQYTESSKYVDVFTHTSIIAGGDEGDRENEYERVRNRREWFVRAEKDMFKARLQWYLRGRGDDDDCSGGSSGGGGEKANIGDVHKGVSTDEGLRCGRGDGMRTDLRRRSTAVCMYCWAVRATNQATVSGRLVLQARSSTNHNQLPS